VFCLVAFLSRIVPGYCTVSRILLEISGAFGGLDEVLLPILPYSPL